METKCAVSGCHNAASYTGAGGLLLDSWEHLFDGGNNGAVVVAYSPIFSSLLYFVNDNPDSGLTAVPRMPYNAAALTADEYKTLKDWIADGAPDASGNIPFASNAESRQKIYAIQQECDVLTVIDAEKNVVMRYIPMGRKASQESMIDLKMSPDGRFLYVAYWFAENEFTPIVRYCQCTPENIMQLMSCHNFVCTGIYFLNHFRKPICTK